MNKRISFFGCSFTAGQELHDHKILNISLEECNQMKKKYMAWEMCEIVNRQLTLGKEPMFQTEIGKEPKLLEYERTIAYPAKLCKILGAEYQNFAKSGSSIEQTYLSLLLLDQNKIIEPDKDVLFIGLTSIERIVTFRQDGSILSLVLGANKVPMEVVEHYTSHKLIWDYFSALNSFMDFAEARGYQLIFQPMLNITVLNPLLDDFKKAFHEVDFETWFLTPAVENIWRRVEKLIVEPSITLQSVCEQYKHPLCGYNHPPEESHQVFAEILAPRMKEILCLKD